jgi:hypothetical protein
MAAHWLHVPELTRTPSLTTPSQRCLSLVFLTFVASPIRAQAPPTLNPVVTRELHTHAQWRVNAHVLFDPTGRLLILYRDNSKLKDNGNWHLIRLTEPLSDKPLREEINFPIRQESSDPDSTRRWENFSSHLLLSPDGNHAYAIFSGAVVTKNSGPPPPGAARNVSVNSFSSVISFDLTAFRVLASADVTQHHAISNVNRIDAEGNLLLLHPTDTDWNIEVLNKSLQHSKTVTISMEPVGMSMRYSCQFRSDFKIECPTNANGVLLLGPESTVHLPPSACKMTLGLDPLGFGKDETLNDEHIIQSDHLCTRNESGNEELVSPDLLPRCNQGWQAAAISTDHHSLLTSCYEPESFLDTFFWSKASLQLMDGLTLAPRVTIQLSSRHRSAYAVYHNAGTTTIAALEDGVRLLLYSCPD